jgi:hypothetical protein
MNHHHLMGKLSFISRKFGILIINFSHHTSTGDDQALYSYPFGMEDDYKDFKVRTREMFEYCF